MAEQFELMAVPGERLDVFVASARPDLTRSRVQKLLADGKLTVNGKTVKAGYKLAEGDVIRGEIPDAAPLEARPVEMDIKVV